MSLFRDHFVISKIARIVILFYVLGIFSNMVYKHIGNAKARNYVMSSDMEGYYQYLPYVLLQEKESIKHMRWAGEYENGNRLNYFTCGVAIMQLPFFLIAHGVSKYFDLETNGYTPVYFMSVFFAALFYVTVGLFFLYKALKRFFDQKYAFWISALIFYATNLFYYTIICPGMSHAYSFSLIAIYIYFVPLFYEKQNFKNALGVIIPLALAVLIRPTNIIAGFYFLLFGVGTWRNFVDRILFLLKKWYWIALMLFVAILVFVPQMLYWHYVTGEYIIYSYQQAGFDNILSPYISTVLIGKRNGLFLYTPIMLLATVGLFLLLSKYKMKFSSVGILLAMVIIVYLDGSWFLPTFSGAAGYRALIEFFPLMAIPLAFVVQNTYQGKSVLLKRFLTGLLIFFVVYNVLFAYNYSHWHWWNTEWQWSYFLRLVKF